MALDPTTVPHSDPGAPISTLLAQVIEGPDAGLKATATSLTLTIGSHPTNDLVLTDPTVSRYHLDLIRDGERVLVVDHGSKNGTIASGVFIQRAHVTAGAVLRLGKSAIKISDGAALTLEVHPHESLGSLRGRSSAMRQVMARLRRAAASDASILVIGETGTGKEVVARTLHELSPRAGGPLETVDCGSILPSLIATELFGHEAGAFTGADRRHIGAFERADGGTLFLDEIGELPTSLQTALLGALERQSFRRVGGTETISVNARIICATNRDLRGEVNRGAFRPDLYYRIAVITLAVPPLRERPEDIPLLIEHFLRSGGYAGPIGELVTPDVLESLMQHSWPGNARELRNVVQAIRVMGEMPEIIQAQAPEAKAEPDAAPASAPAEFAGLLELPYNEARSQLLGRFESTYLHELLVRHRGNLTKAARNAQVDRSYLTRLAIKHGLRMKRGAGDEG